MNRLSTDVYSLKHNLGEKRVLVNVNEWTSLSSMRFSTVVSTLTSGVGVLGISDVDWSNTYSLNPVTFTGSQLKVIKERCCSAWRVRGGFAPELPGSSSVHPLKKAKLPVRMIPIFNPFQCTMSESVVLLSITLDGNQLPSGWVYSYKFAP